MNRGAATRCGPFCFWAKERDHGLSGSGGGRHGQCGPRDVADAVGAQLSGRRGGRPGVAALGRRRRLLRRGGGAEGPAPRPIQLQGHRHRAVLGRRQGLGRVRAARGRGWRHRDRQHLVLPHGPGRAAGGAGGQSAGDRRLQEEEHHRQPELLHHPDGGGAEAAARRGADQARGGGDLPVGVGRAARMRWTSCSTRLAAST